MGDTCDSITESCPNHPECTLQLTSAQDHINGGDQIQITATGAHGTVNWIVITGESTLNTLTGNVVTLTGSDTHENVFIAAIDSLECAASIDIMVCNATITSQTVATSPADRARLKLGVGEEVELTATQGAATWQITSGSGTLSPDTGTHETVTFTAGESAGDVTITATGTPCVSTITFNVVEPSDFTMVRKSGTRILHGGIDGAGNWIGTLRPDCGWLGEICVHPNDVNFYRVRVREQDSRSQTSGSMAIPQYTNQLHGHYSSGFSPWIPLGRHRDANGTRFAGAGAVDHIYINCIASIFGTGPTFSAGGLHWDIQWQWKVGTGRVRNFQMIQQRHALRTTGQCDSAKAGHSESAAYNAPLQDWT